MKLVVKMTCDGVYENSKARVLCNTEVGDTISLEANFNLRKETNDNRMPYTFGAHNKFLVTNERTKESAWYTYNEFIRAIYNFDVRQI